MGPPQGFPGVQQSRLKPLSLNSYLLTFGLNPDCWSLPRALDLGLIFFFFSPLLVLPLLLFSDSKHLAPQMTQTQPRSGPRSCTPSPESVPVLFLGGSWRGEFRHKEPAIKTPKKTETKRTHCRCKRYEINILLSWGGCESLQSFGYNKELFLVFTV